MDARILVAAVLIAAIALTAGGCQTLTALGTEERRGEPGGDIKVIVIEGRTAGTASGQDGTGLSRSHLPDDQRVKDFCAPPVPEVAGALVPLAMAAFQIAYGEGVGAIKGYVEKKRDRFTKSYGGRVNIAAFHIERSQPDGGQTERVVRCLRLTRTMPTQADAPGDMAGTRLVSDIVVGFQANATGTAMTVKPLYAKLDGFAASTSPGADGDLAKVSLTVGVSLINQAGGPGEATIDKYEQNFLLPGVKRGQSFDLSKHQPSAYMPLPQGRPATIAIAVTETGNGVDRFEGFSDDFATNSTIIGDALGNVLKSKLEGDQ